MRERTRTFLVVLSMSAVAPALASEVCSSEDLRQWVETLPDVVSFEPGLAGVALSEAGGCDLPPLTITQRAQIVQSGILVGTSSDVSKLAESASAALSDGIVVIPFGRVLTADDNQKVDTSWFQIAAMFGSEHVPVTFSSTPTGASVWLGTKLIGTTVRSAGVRRSALGQLRFELDGYRTCAADEVEIVQLLGGEVFVADCSMVAIKEE